MEEKNVYLNEERYQKTNKKVKKLALIILFIAIIIGGGLIATGIILSNKSKSDRQVKVDEIQVKINDIESQITTLASDIDALQIEQSKIFRDEHGFSDNYYAKQSEMQSKQSEKSKLQIEESKLKTEKHKIENDFDYPLLLCVLGGFIVLAGLPISFMAYIVSKRREIAAYSVQQVMPVAKEGIETVAPSVGVAAKEITKGIKDGLNDEE